MPNEIKLLLDLSTVDAEERVRNFIPIQEELSKNLALCNMRTEKEFNVAMTIGATVFKTSPLKMEEFLRADQLVDQCEDISRFDVNGRKRKRGDEVAEKLQTKECDVTQPKKKIRPSVSDNIPLNKGSHVVGLEQNQAKFYSKENDPCRKRINVLRLVKRRDNYYTCEVKNSAQPVQKQSTRDHIKVSCVGQNLGANSRTTKRKLSTQVACLGKVEPFEIKMRQKTSECPFERESILPRKSTSCPKTRMTCNNFDRPISNEVVPVPSECQANEPALTNKKSETRTRNLFEVLQRMKRALAKDRSNKKERKGPVRTPKFVRIRKQVGNLFEMRARIISRNMRS